MQSLLERLVASSDSQLVVLAPHDAIDVPDWFRNVPVDESGHASLVADAQRLRGSVYLADGAIRPRQLTSDGRHVAPEDQKAWHLLITGPDGVKACMWYLDHQPSVTFDDLRVRTCPLIDTPGGRRSLKTAVRRELMHARMRRLHFIELGGWAVAEEARHTGEGLLLALAAFSMGRAMGGALGMTTATVRHASAAILRRLGGSSLRAPDGEVPSYYDPRYDCEMEILRFDSRSPNPKYGGVIEFLKDRLATVPVLTTGQDVSVEATGEVREWLPVAGAGGAAA
jgi:hypothetical protein